MFDTEYQSEIHKLLRLGERAGETPIHGAPEGLPVSNSHVAAYDLNAHDSEMRPVLSRPAFTITNPHAAVLDNAFNKSLNQIGQAAIEFKSFLVYPVIFIIAFAFFYVVLNFSSLLAQVQGMFTPPQTQQILGSDLTEYYQWINNYYYAVGDQKLLDPNNDIDKDGLSNMDEFIMHTNPIVADSDGDGFSDGIEIINGMNPWGSGAETPAQVALAKGLDINLINNRISYNASAIHGGVVSGANTTKYDLNKPGQISIPRLNLQVSLIWSKDPSDFETDLTQGVIHYPGTALPGEQGTIYVSGHSSDYIWKHDPMQSIFARLNFLKPGDDIFVDVYGLDGKTYNFRYQVTGSNIYKPDDQTQFIDNSTNKLNLSTCWPIGTSTNRLVVSAVQVGL